MRILLSIAMFLAGCGLVAYSWIGAFIRIAEEIDKATSFSQSASQIMMVIERVMEGDIPQMTTFFYIGLFIIVISVINLFGLFRSERNEDS